MEIKCGNCLELLAELTDGLIDMVITDPPYNISVKNNFATMGRTGIDFGDWDKGFDLLSWIDIASQKLTKKRWHDNLQRLEKFRRYCKTL
ncbi:hypothetical protein Z496_01129 [Streptococcus pyogenes ABC020054973]|nr:hypothetical protein Z496_01129 [Streptococcus pyogenes ABC020054973]